MCPSESGPGEVDGWLRVTTILRVAGLMDPRWWTPESADRGTAVHAYLAQRLRDRMSAPPIDQAIDQAIGQDPDRVIGYLRAVDAFIRECRPVPIFVEHEVTHPIYRYYGHLDGYVQIGRQAVLIDAKTGSRPPWVGLQTAAYALALANQPEVTTAPADIPRAALVLRPDGSYRLERLLDYAREIKTFLDAVVFAKRKVGQCLPDALRSTRSPSTPEHPGTPSPTGSIDGDARSALVSTNPSPPGHPPGHQEPRDRT